MASIYDLKPTFQRLLRPVVAGLARSGVTANQVTVAAVVLSAGAGAAVAWAPTSPIPLLAYPAVLFVRMALNAVDGMLAREHDQASPSGAILNELGDVLADAALYLPLAWVPGVSAPLVTIVVILAVMVEMTGVCAVQIGASRRYDGPMGKSDRAFVFGALALGLGLGVPTGWWLDGLLGLVVLLSVWTVWNRATRALREVSS